MMRNIYGLFLCFFLVQFQLQAQSPEDLKLSDHTVIENVMLVEKAGLSPKRVNVIIRKGVIKDITTSKNYPKDAIVISADSMYAYPAFIDAASHTAYPKVDNKEKQERAKDPGNPTYERAGVTPEKTVEENLKLDDSSVGKMRKAGFAVSHVLPRGRMLSGQGSVILLKENDNTPYLIKNASQYGSFKSSQGRVYPSTLIGVMSKHRELFEQAKNAKQYEMKYNSNPLGLDRPAYPAQIQALYPVIEKKTPFFFNAEKTLDISRALKLNEDLGTRMILTEVKQVGPNMKKIKSSGLPVLLSLDLPKNMEEKKDSTKVITDAEQNLIDRKKAAINEYQNQAAILKKNGVKFAFSFLDSKPGDLTKKVDILLANGMSKDDVLNALTVYPAEILGISNVTGSLQKNKLANIILTDGELFEKETNIVYTIVEGEMHKYEVKKKKAVKGDPNAKVDLAGMWSLVAKIPGDEQNAKLRFKKSDEEYTGVLIDDEGDEYPLEDISLEGDMLSFTFNVAQEGVTLSMTGSVKIVDDSFEGTLSVGEFGSFPLEGSKISNPKN